MNNKTIDEFSESENWAAYFRSLEKTDKERAEKSEVDNAKTMDERITILKRRLQTMGAAFNAEQIKSVAAQLFGKENGALIFSEIAETPNKHGFTRSIWGCEMYLQPQADGRGIIPDGERILWEHCKLWIKVFMQVYGNGQTKQPSTLMRLWWTGLFANMRKREDALFTGREHLRGKVKWKSELAKRGDFEELRIGLDEPTDNAPAQREAAQERGDG